MQNTLMSLVKVTVKKVSVRAVVKVAAIVTVSAVLSSTPIYADDKVGHFAGKASSSLEQAFVNLKEYNSVLAAIAAKDNLTALDAHTVHETTYTLEKALEKIKADLETTQASLELLHKASEKNAAGDIKTLTQTYLKESKRFLTQP